MANEGYLGEVKEIILSISPSLIDFNSPRERGRMPTQASSEFITNREQGDWAEDLVLRAINESRLDYVAVKYGKSEKRVTGEEGFQKFFEDYQNELEIIGKRPDILIFHRNEYNDSWNYDISTMNVELLDNIVPLAKAGVEIRSSSFLYDKYNLSQEIEIRDRVNNILQIKNKLLNEYSDILLSKSGYLKIIEEINEETLNILSFRCPSWSSNQRLKEASSLLKQLKLNLTGLQKRNHLSITPKIEDIKVVSKWIEYYKVPHFYFQVFFDKVFGIAFKDILTLLADSSNEDVNYFLEADVKNQNKTTIKINPTLGFLIAEKVEMPNHLSKLKELNRGRLLFYVTFEGGFAYLNVENLLNNLGLNI